MRGLAIIAVLLASQALATTSHGDRALAVEPNPQGTAAAIRVLRDFALRDEGEAGFAWWMGLRLSVRARLSQSPELLLWRHRVEFLRDAGRGDAPACAISGRGVLTHPLLGCDHGQELLRFLSCTAALPADQRDAARAGLPLDRRKEEARPCSAGQLEANHLAREALGGAGHPAPP